MEHRPPPLSNGFVWVAHTLIRAERLRELENSLATSFRFEMETRDIRELGTPYDAEMELWVHPDDLDRLEPLIRQALLEE